jgi:hypothetical protein
LIQSNDKTDVWTQTDIREDFTELLVEIGDVSTNVRWLNAYNWYVKGLTLLEATDDAEFTEAVMKSTIIALREELLLLYFKKWDELTSSDTVSGRGSNTGRAAQMFALLDYIPDHIETGGAIGTDSAYDRQKYIFILHNAK